MTSEGEFAASYAEVDNVSSEGFEMDINKCYSNVRSTSSKTKPQCGLWPILAINFLFVLFNCTKEQLIEDPFSISVFISVSAVYSCPILATVHSKNSGVTRIPSLLHTHTKMEKGVSIEQI